MQPGRLGVINNLGNVLQSLGRHAEAESCYREALGLEPELAEALYNLGVTLHALGRPDEARACHEKLLGILLAAGNGLAAEGRQAEAIDCYQCALSLRPDDADTLNQLGVLLDAQGRRGEALKELRRARELAPRDPDIAYHLGLVLHSTGDYAAAIDCYDRSLELAPERGETSLARALSLLAMGDYARGFRAYECRYTARFERPRVAKPDFAFPMWRGEALAGKRILLATEQGYGDQIQFLRFAAVLDRQGATVDVIADARMQRLAAGVPGVRAVLPGLAPGAGGYDYWSLLLSVPLWLGTKLDSVPAEIPYLRPPAEEVKKWADRLRALPQGRLKVGLVWTAGNTSRENLHGRSMGFDALQPLARLAGISFVGLQFGERAQEHPVAAGFPALQLGAEVGDFADNAALIANLDLLVTVDTAAGHLAGALGIPAWILLPASPDWRWGWGRSDSPWYPSLKLLRQAQLGDWTPLVERLAQDLQRLAARSA